MSALETGGMAAAAVLAVSCMLFVARRRRLATKRRIQKKHGVLDSKQWTGRDSMLRDVTRATGSYDLSNPNPNPNPNTNTNTNPNINPNPNLDPGPDPNLHQVPTT